MKVAQHIVNLDLKPNKRWEFLKEYTTEINELLEYYLNDFEALNQFFYAIKDYKSAFIPKEYNEEIEFIASISKFSSDEIMIANLYYDILKFYFGCTAFAYYERGTVFHARNLDWHSSNNLLSKHTKIFDFQKAHKSVYKTVGWPGFIGVLSGTKPNHFSITLNAILSDDPPQIAYPISFLIRDVLEKENSFEAAKLKLAKTELIGDSLLLLSGLTQEELVVIERSPSRFAIRNAKSNAIAVTNDYKILKSNTILNTGNLLQETSCGRHDRALELLRVQPPKNTNDCIKILSDEKIQMQITVQQMVFNNVTGEIKARGINK